MRRKKIVVSVTNDLATDQRVARVCNVLHSLDFEVVLVGRRLKSSLPISRPYDCVRFQLPFTKGVLFYAAYQLRLFWFLLFSKFDVLLSNDLDTLLPNYLAAQIKSKPLVYDTHEYFCGVPELQERPFVQKVWKTVEKAIFPKLKTVFTVNQSIADIYASEYGVMPKVVRNIGQSIAVQSWRTREALGLPEEKYILINQGTGINVDRGMEEMLAAVKLLDDVLLLLVGSGDVIPKLKEAVANDVQLQEKVLFVPKMPYADLLHYTRNADIGLSLDKPTNINYRLSLPNKIFDYIQCGIPILASHLPEVSQIVLGNQVGITVHDHEPNTLAEAVRQLRREGKSNYAASLEKAAKHLTWDQEKLALEKVYSPFTIG